MTGWWNTRTARERGLLICGLLVLGAAISYQFVLLPALGHANDAKFQRERAAQTLQRMDRIAERAASGHMRAASSVTHDLQVLRSQGEALAGEAGLTVREITTTDSGHVHYILEPALPQQVFTWVEDVEMRLGADVSSATISASESGRVNAEIQFSPGDRT